MSAAAIVCARVTPRAYSSCIGCRSSFASRFGWNGLPVDKITQVSVLDPYFYR